MSGPVPSPSMKGRMGSGGTLGLPSCHAIGRPCAMGSDSYRFRRVLQDARQTGGRRWSNARIMAAEGKNETHRLGRARTGDGRVCAPRRRPANRRIPGPECTLRGPGLRRFFNQDDGPTGRRSIPARAAGCARGQEHGRLPGLAAGRERRLHAGQTAVKAGVATLADTAVLLEGQLGEGWCKVYVEEIVDGQRYPIKWYSLPVVQTESTGGRILAIHASYHRKHADLHDGTLRFIV